MFKRAGWAITIGGSIIILGLVWWICLSGKVLRLHSQNAGNRDAIMRIYKAISVGATQRDVEAAYEQYRTPELTIQTAGAETIIVGMPLEISERHWKLVVFLESGRVVGYNVRDGDGRSLSDAPDDVGVTK
jgi:hypothetical protein